MSVIFTPNIKVTKLLTIINLKFEQVHLLPDDASDDAIKTLNYNTPPLLCRKQITLSNIYKICP